MQRTQYWKGDLVDNAIFEERAKRAYVLMEKAGLDLTRFC
jgi:hypothetical protein